MGKASQLKFSVLLGVLPTLRLACRAVLQPDIFSIPSHSQVSTMFISASFPCTCWVTHQTFRAPVTAVGSSLERDAAISSRFPGRPAGSPRVNIFAHRFIASPKEAPGACWIHVKFLYSRMKV